MDTKKIRKLQMLYLILFLITAIVFAVISKTKTWNYPDFNIVETAPSDMTLYLLRLGIIAVLGIGLSAAFSIYTKAHWTKSSVISIICVAVYLLYLLLHKEWIGYEVQQLLIGNYVMFCYVIAGVGKKETGDRGGSIIYILSGIVSMVFSKYSFLYDEFIQGRPLILLYMAIVFVTVYAAVFWEHEKKERIKKRWYISVFTVLALVVVFSGERILDIIRSIIGNSSENWLIYRWTVWKAMLTGRYIDSAIDISCKVHVRDFHILWLRQAFSAALSISYLLILILFMGFLYWMLQREKKNNVLKRTIIFSILITNFLGIVAEMNMFWGASIGILLSQNLYQMIPVIWLIFENTGNCEISS